MKSASPIWPSMLAWSHGNHNPYTSNSIWWHNLYAYARHDTAPSNRANGINNNVINWWLWNTPSTNHCRIEEYEGHHATNLPRGFLSTQNCRMIRFHAEIRFWNGTHAKRETVTESQIWYDTHLIRTTNWTQTTYFLAVFNYFRMSKRTVLREPSTLVQYKFPLFIDRKTESDCYLTPLLWYTGAGVDSLRCCLLFFLSLSFAHRTEFIIRG